MEEIKKEQVEELAILARLGLTEKEKVSLQVEMTSFLEYFSMLEEVDTSKIQPTNQVTGLGNVYRDDIIKKCKISVKDLLENVPDHEGTFIKVKKVLE
jgi:aspartyl-tRNA(Asn)/glutamyl-tRNA(Gln) amidotransferase subunit C